MFRQLLNLFRSGDAPKQPRKTVLRMDALEAREVPVAGLFDTSFGVGGKVALNTGAPNVNSATVEHLSNGQILVGATNAFGADYDWTVTRLNRNGSVDRSFGVNGEARVSFDRGGNKQDWLIDMDVDSRGRIVLAGSVEFGGGDYDFGVARLLSNGRPDTSFGTGGKTTVHFDRGGTNVDIPTAVEVDRSDRIVVCGTTATGAAFGTRDIGVTRLTTAGRLDTTFGSGGRSNASFNRNGLSDDICGGMEIDRNGRIVIAVSTQYRPNSTDYDFGVCRLNTNGFFDQTFGTGGKAVKAFDMGQGNVDMAKDVALTPDGGVVVAGDVQRRAVGDTDFAVVKFTSAGRIDTRFGPSGNGTSFRAFDLGTFDGDYVSSVAVDGGGRIVVAGTINRNGDDRDFGVVRFRADGRLDPNFGNNGGTVAAIDLGGSRADYAGGIAIDGLSNILVAGIAKTAAGTNKAVVTRIDGGTIVG